MNELIHQQKTKAEEVLRRALFECIRRRNQMVSHDKRMPAARIASYALCLLLACAMLAFFAVDVLHYADHSPLSREIEKALFLSSMRFTDASPTFFDFLMQSYKPLLLIFELSFAVSLLLMSVSIKKQMGDAKLVKAELSRVNSAISSINNYIRDLDFIAARYETALRSRRDISLADNRLPAIHLDTLGEFTIPEPADTRKLDKASNFFFSIAALIFGFLFMTSQYHNVSLFLTDNGLMPSGLNPYKSDLLVAWGVVALGFYIFLSAYTRYRMPTGFLRILVVSSYPFCALAASLLGYAAYSFLSDISPALSFAIVGGSLVLIAVIRRLTRRAAMRKFDKAEKDARDAVR